MQPTYYVKHHDDTYSEADPQPMRVALTKEQAQEIVSAHEISMAEGDEETELLDSNNPELAEAYRALLAMADA